MGLHDTFREFHRLLRGELTPAEAAVLFPADEARLRTYQRFVEGHIRSVLEKNYATLPPLLGRTRWDQLADDFFRQVPAEDYELNACVASFPDFLRLRLEEGAPGLTQALVELARLEWAEFAVWGAEAEVPSPAGVTAPTLNPTLEVLEFEYPVASFLTAWRKGPRGERPGLPIEPAAEVAFVFRHPRSLGHAFHTATDPLLFAFKVAHDGLQLAAAAAEAGVSIRLAEELLLQASDLGLVVLPADFPRGELPCSDA